MRFEVLIERWNYSNRVFKQGDQFDETNEFNINRLVQMTPIVKVVPKSQYLETAAVKAEESQEEKPPARRKRKYMRRDMQPES